MIEFESRIQPNLIIRPLSVYHTFIDKNYGFFSNKSAKRKGLALCHGHNYHLGVISKLKFVDNWYYVDISRATYPDYVADVSNIYQMEYFPNNYFDCVITMFCPISSNDERRTQYPAMLENIQFILKKNGVLALTELPRLFYWFINDAEFDEIIKRLYEIIPEENLRLFKEQLLKDHMLLSDSSDRSFHMQLMLNYHGDEKKKS